MGKTTKLYLIIAFLLGIISAQCVYALKVPDIILPDSINSDLQDMLGYITDILNNGKYVMTVSSSAVSSTDSLNAGEFLLDDNGVSKYICVSNGTTNYRVEVTAIP